MDEYKSLRHQVINRDEQPFVEVALKVFNYQAQHNPVYKDFLGRIGVSPHQVSSLQDIPFLPISLFKHKQIVTGKFQPQKVFQSSGTTQQVRSQHLVRDLGFYLKTAQRIFEHYYGPLEQFNLIALLPNYVQQGQSSLVAMVDHFIKATKSRYSGFYLNDMAALPDKLARLDQNDNRTILLWGVSFALLDLAELGQLSLPRLLVMETGGMKGRRKELTRAELHERLKYSFNVNQISSEYGMAELTAQAYAPANGWFSGPSWMKVLTRKIDDPWSYTAEGRTGVLNIIDLSNLHSCAFVATEDLGTIQGSQFQVLGRMDNSEVRGCSLMV